MIKRLLLLGLVLLFNVVRAQEADTLRLMTYNLLMYGNNFSNCTSTTNNIASKDGYLKTITKYVKPDIFIANEMGASAIYADRIIENVLNTDGENKYKRVAVQNNSFSNIVNGVFYNKKKFGLLSQAKISKDVNNNELTRVIDVCRFYYKDPSLTASSDTVIINVCAAHLKAGSSSSDEGSRALETEALMNYLGSQLSNQYTFLGGDLNVKGSSEDGFQNLIDPAAGIDRFYDPIDELGSWNANSGFAAVHSQSTRSSNTNSGCFSGGGLDDRFDFLLATGQVIEDSGQVNYVVGSYRTVGQDGNHYNTELNDGSNNSVPSTVLGALYEMSDHLPIRMDIAIQKLELPVVTPPEGFVELRSTFDVRFNPNKIIVNQPHNTEVTIVSMLGQPVFNSIIAPGRSVIDGQLDPGMYIMIFEVEGHQLAYKFVR